uniref:Mic1 domain-containing protein n=1 Tax=Elaeophora elaphi TaxID=1147741 RepID=A0A0R3RQ00_9BILA
MISLDTVRSNRSLVAANQQLRIQLALAKAEINRLQNEIVDLQKRITGLESTSDEERIEMIQRVQHLKSITNRTVQYMEKTKADFDHAANRLDYTLLSNNFDDGVFYAGECSQSVSLPLSCGTGDEVVGRRVQQPPTLEAVEEDIYGEMDENEDVNTDKYLIVPINNDGFKLSSDGRKSSRDSRRETFFVKKELDEFDPPTSAVLARPTTPTMISIPETSISYSAQTVSSLSIQPHEDQSAAAVKISTTISVPKTPTVFPKLETPTTSSRSISFKSKTLHDENIPMKKIRKSEVVTHSRKKRRNSINGTPKRCKKSSESNAKAMKENNKLLITPMSLSSTGILSAVNLNGSVRCKRAAAAKIPSFKEPSLITKMRNPNFQLCLDGDLEKGVASSSVKKFTNCRLLFILALLLMLRIGEPHVIFESGSALSEIFYDDVNKKIVTVRGDDVVEVKAYGLESNEIASFRLKNKSKIRAIKFSPDKRLICVQYDESTVDFINFVNFNTDTLSTCFSQSTKNRSAHIIGLEWILNSQILYITNQGLELYQVNPEKKSVKLLKSYNISLYWYLYYPYSQLLIVSCGVAGALLNPFVIQNGSIHRLMKFEVEFGCSNTKPRLLEREVFIISIYNALYIAVLRSGTRNSTSSDIVLYKMSMDGAEVPKLAHILHLDMVGAFALHGFDNLVIVHHQSSKTSLVFDVGLEEVSKGDCISYPLFKTSLNCSDSLQAKFSHEFKLYSPFWVMFQPNFIADASVGVFTSMSLNSVEAENYIEDKYQYLRFLYNRRIPKSEFLEILRHCVVANKLKLKQLEYIFNWFAKATAKRCPPISRHGNSGVKYVLMAEQYEEIAVEQGDVVGNLFLLPDGYTLDQKQRFLQYMLRYLIALRENKLEVQSVHVKKLENVYSDQLYPMFQPYFLNEILVPTMITTGQLERLHQFLLYRIIPDSKQLVCSINAFQLLSHEAKYSPLVQLTLDMLSRLGTATEEIVEILIARSLVVEAIRFLESSQSADKVNALKLIESAWKENRLIRYAVFTYFLERGSKVRNCATNSGQFEEFLKKFETLFDDEEIEAARKDFHFMSATRNEL